ncbi:MAG: hypothetical protein ABI589_00645 [Burkholderiales bacterium]
MRSKLVGALVALVALSAASAASAAAPAQAKKSNSASACGTLKKGALGKPVSGFDVKGASIESVKPSAPESSSQCTLVGKLAGERAAAPVRFRLELPKDWNRRAVQFAAGIDAPHDVVDPQAALAAGFAPYGPLDAGVAATAQRRLRDVAAELLARRYGRLTDQFYLVSGPGGGMAAVALAIGDPRAFRGVLADAREPSGGTAGAEKAAEGPDASKTANFGSYANKILIAAPPVASSAAAEPALIRWFSDYATQTGQRSADHFLRVLRLPADAAQTQAGAKVDRLTPLAVWAEVGTAPPDATSLMQR